MLHIHTSKVSDYCNDFLSCTIAVPREKSTRAMKAAPQTVTAPVAYPKSTAGLSKRRLHTQTPR